MSQALSVEQAEKCLCPFVGVTSSGLCKADQCMGWAWAQEPQLFAKTRIQIPLELIPSKDDFLVPEGTGWQIAGGPHRNLSFFEFGNWFLNFRRDSDPERPGYCSMIQQPGEAA